MNKKMAIALMTLGFGISHADEVYKLQPGENISSLLVNRLGHHIIYRNKYLDQILKYNNLNRQSARKLRIGKEIKIPSSVIQAIANETTIATPEVPTIQEAPSTAAETIRWLRLAGKVENLRGKSVGTLIPNDYSLVIARPILGLGFDRFTDVHEIYSSIETSFVQLAADSSRISRDKFFMGEGSLLYRKRLNNDWSLGGLGKYGQEIYVEVKSSQKYEMHTPWIFGVGPHLGFKNLGFSTLIIPSQKIVNNLSTKANYKFHLNYKIKHHHNYWELESTYANLSTQSSDVGNLGFKVQYNWKF